MAEENPFLGPATSAESENPFLGPATIEEGLSNTRAGHIQELSDNPETAVKLYKLTKNEVGGQGGEAQQAFLESVFNRATARKQTITDVVNDRKYYPAASHRDFSISEDTDTGDYVDALDNVIKGGNISGFATGNASGSVGFGGGPQTAAFGGEKFGIEAPDLKGEQVETRPFVGPDKFKEYIPDLLDQEEEIALAKKVEQDHPIFNNAVKAASEMITGIIPKDSYELAKALSPALQIYSIATSDNPALAFNNTIPVARQIPQIIAAEQTPPGSQERFAAGFGMIADILGAAGAAKGLSGKPIEMPKAATVPEGVPEVPSFGALSEPLNPVPGSGKFRATYQIDKQLGDMMEGIGAAREAGSLMGETAVRRVFSELNPAQQTELGQYLVSERLMLENPQHPQILSLSEMQRIADKPAIARAIDTYRNEIEPEVESLHMRAGVTESQAGRIRGKYTTLVPKTDEMLPQFQVPPQVRAARVSRITKFAREAKGMAKEYSTDLREILGQAYSEANRKALLNDFYKEAKRKGITETDKFEDLPPQIANNLNEIIGPKSQPTGALKTWRAIQRGATSAALTANPSELMNHMRRQWNLLAAKPPVGSGLVARMEWILPYIGPKTGAFVRVVTTDMSKPSNMAVLQDVFNAGGGSARSFSSMYELRGPVAKYTGLKWLQKKTHGLLFGIPKGRGVGGWDLRMRVQLEKIRRAAEGNRDPQRIREFANQIGQYGAHPDWIIGALREINPYAATTLPMRLTELKTSVGISGLKSEGAMRKMLHTAETQLRGTGGTILALTSANKFLSGKYPWENDPGHEFDLNTGTTGANGKRIYLKLRVIGPELSRPVSTVGLPNLARERTSTEPQFLSALLTAFANQGLSIVGGPAQNAFLTATTGKVPYLVKSPGRSPELMDVAKTEEGQSRGVEQIKRAVAGLNPLGESIVAPRYEPELTPALKLFERPVFGFRGVRPLGSMFSESYEKKPPKHPPSRAQIRSQMIRKIKEKARKEAGVE